MPSFAFSEAALSIFHVNRGDTFEIKYILQRLVQRIKDEQDSNPFLYFDKYALLVAQAIAIATFIYFQKHSTLFQKLEDLHKTLFDVAVSYMSQVLE